MGASNSSHGINPKLHVHIGTLESSVQCCKLTLFAPSSGATEADSFVAHGKKKNCSTRVRMHL